MRKRSDLTHVGDIILDAARDPKVMARLLGGPELVRTPPPEFIDEDPEPGATA